MNYKKALIIGAGLAGTETAYQLATLVPELTVDLYEMRPKVKTEAHHTDNLAELVCSNSLGSEFLTTARGLLITEMRRLSSLIISSALEAKVPAGQALAVDRDKFAEIITSKITSLDNVNLIRDEFKNLNQAIEEYDFTVIASGPLTSKNLASEIQTLIPGQDFLKFFDAASPILTVDSVNMDIAFKASRYDKGETDDYINCPFYLKEDYYNFVDEILAGEKAPQKDFEKNNVKFFESCLPVEEIARRGRDTLRFGPLKPVGLIDERRQNDKFPKPYAVVQLRQDNVIGSLYNIVGFQTNLKWGEQKRIFSMIPGLENVDIVRYGVMHQNIYINSPACLNSDYSLKSNSKVYFAGQITGVEGYTESAATGLIVARSIAAKYYQREFKPLAKQTMLGALANYIASADSKNFQPINSNWGLINTNPGDLTKEMRRNKKLKNEFLAERALRLMDESLEQQNHSADNIQPLETI
jgi:methylenetetrahydrofolate--tRNA-(uracil-5-)-methyltransferase